ncbi:MAG: hypothetical protein R3277_06905 [Brumimicrobium sp.]|nr:hypothetical protein [Brumimicrobium sp.]
MAGPEKERKSKMQALITELKSGEENRIETALKGLQVHGDDEAILPILEVWNAGVSSKAEQEIITFLSDIKSSSSVDPIMEVLTDSHFKRIHHPLLTTIWNTKVDYSAYLTDFVRIATENDFMTALECLTIIENMEGPFEEHHFLESEIALRAYAERTQKSKDSEDERKLQLVREIGRILKDFETNNINL